MPKPPHTLAAKDQGVNLVAMQTDNFGDWKKNFIQAQTHDFVIFGSFDGIANWDMQQAETHIQKHTNTFSLTSHDWMMPLSALGYTTLPEEQGECAAASAIAIINGTSPASIPIVTNRKWDTWVNQKLLNASGVSVPTHVVDGAKLF